MRFDEYMKRRKWFGHTEKLGDTLNNGLQELQYNIKLSDMSNLASAVIVMYLNGLLSKATVKYLKSVICAVVDMYNEDDYNQKELDWVLEMVRNHIMRDSYFSARINPALKFEEAIEELNNLGICVRWWIYHYAVDMLQVIPDMYCTTEKKLYFVVNSDTDDMKLCKVSDKELMDGIYGSKKFPEDFIEAGELSNRFLRVDGFDRNRGILYCSYKGMPKLVAYAEYHLNIETEVYKGDCKFIGVMKSGAVVYRSYKDNSIYYKKHNHDTIRLKDYSYTEEYDCEYDDYILVLPAGIGCFFKPYKLYLDGTIRAAGRELEERVLWRRLIANVVWDKRESKDLELHAVADVIRFERCEKLPIGMTISGIMERISGLIDLTKGIDNSGLRFYEFLGLMENGMDNNTDIMEILYVMMNYTVECYAIFPDAYIFPSKELYEYVKGEVYAFLEEEECQRFEDFKVCICDDKKLAKKLKDNVSMIFSAYYDDQDEEINPIKIARRNLDIEDNMRMGYKLKKIGGFIIDAKGLLNYETEYVYQGNRMWNMVVPKCAMKYWGEVWYDILREQHMVLYNRVLTKEELEQVYVAFGIEKADVMVS